MIADQGHDASLHRWRLFFSNCLISGIDPIPGRAVKGMMPAPLAAEQAHDKAVLPNEDQAHPAGLSTVVMRTWCCQPSGLRMALGQNQGEKRCSASTRMRSPLGTTRSMRISILLFIIALQKTSES